MASGENQLVDWLRQRFPADPARVPVSIGDDAAVVRLDGSLVMITADMLLDTVHFDTRHHTFKQIGRKAIAARLNMSPANVHAVATFYNQFRFVPPGKHPIKVCLGTACHVRGGDIILENFERKLGIKYGETTPDREFSIERVACVGCCALAPVAIVDETIQGNMAPSKVEGLLLGFEIEKEKLDREMQKKNDSK